MSSVRVGDGPYAPAQPLITLHEGDCFDVLRSLPDNSVGMVLCDPPYGTTLLPFDKAARKDKIDWQKWWAEIHRVARPQAIIACFAAQPFTTDLINANRKFFRYSLVWSKTYSVGHLSANVRPMRAHEDILIFCQRFGPLRVRQGEHLVSRMQSTYNPQFTEGMPYVKHYRAAPARHYSAQRGDLPTSHNLGRRYPTSVLTFGRDNPCRHPTQKPLGLLRWLLRTYSNRGDLVLDTFAGSGSTLVAARAEGRSAIGVERDPAFVAVAQDWLAEGQTAP